MSDTPNTDAMQRIMYEGCQCIVAAPEDIEALERELAAANRRIGYLLRVSGLGRIEAVDEAIRREAGEVKP